MVNNFKSIGQLLEWNNESDFYFVQILRRKKENPEIGSNSYLIKSYFISSLQHLNDMKDEMIHMANYFNARVYINLNRRSYEKCSLQTARLILDQIANKDYKSSKKAFNSVCGRYSSETDKKWIIDIDIKDISLLEIISNEIRKIQPEGEKTFSAIETKNGYHLITKPFNLLEFNALFDIKSDNKLCKYEKPEVHKNNPTVLYIP